MRIIVNNEPKTVQASQLGDILTELGYGDAKIATAVDGEFIPASKRAHIEISENACLEVLAPMQGG